MPLAKDISDFAFADTPINEGLVRDLAGGRFLAEQRNVVLVGGAGTGKTHLAIDRPPLSSPAGLLVHRRSWRQRGRRSLSVLRSRPCGGS